MLFDYLTVYIGLRFDFNCIFIAWTEFPINSLKIDHSDEQTMLWRWLNYFQIQFKITFSNNSHVKRILSILSWKIYTSREAKTKRHFDSFLTSNDLIPKYKIILNILRCWAAFQRSNLVFAYLELGFIWIFNIRLIGFGRQNRVIFNRY